MGLLIVISTVFFYNFLRALLSFLKLIKIKLSKATILRKQGEKKNRHKKVQKYIEANSFQN